MKAGIETCDSIDVGNNLENGLYYAIENLLSEIAKLNGKLARRYTRVSTLDEDYDMWVVGSYCGRSTKVSVYKSTMRWLSVFDPNFRKVRDPDKRAVITSDIQDQLLRKVRNSV
ncbi:MAG: hypothetical protein ACXQT4_03150 [Methanotrichaceae archaeon]